MWDQSIQTFALALIRNSADIQWDWSSELVKVCTSYPNTLSYPKNNIGVTIVSVSTKATGTGDGVQHARLSGPSNILILSQRSYGNVRIWEIGNPHRTGSSVLKGTEYILGRAPHQTINKLLFVFIYPLEKKKKTKLFICRGGRKERPSDLGLSEDSEESAQAEDGSATK